MRAMRGWAESALVVWVGLCVLSSVAHSQDENDPSVPTLRVYTNLLQIPTLILDSHHRPIPNLVESRFRVSIDSGPKSRVTHVRVEGDDPIALAILVEGPHLPGAVRSRLSGVVAGLVPNSLHGGDSLSLYKLDCALTRAVVAKPITAGGLGQSAELMFGQAKGVRKQRESEGCQQHWNLLDSIAAAVQGLQNEPGRRVLLVVSDGQDHGSRTSWDAARAFASEKGVAIFGILATSEVALAPRGPRGMLGVETVAETTNMPALCESTGGMVLDDANLGTAAQLRDFVALIRRRYIVEFPRPDAEAGFHQLEISVEKLNGALIWPAGASVPVADPELAKDPNTIISGPENAPPVGTKRPKR